MADRLRIVERVGPRRPVEILDLQDLEDFHLVRDTFSLTPPAQRARTVQSGNRYGGAQIVGMAHDNAVVGATWLVKGATVDEAIRNAEAIVAQCESALSLPTRYIEWKSEFATYPTYWQRRGPAAWTPTYRWVQMTQARSWEFQITWPVAPLAEWDRMDILDDFAVDSISDYAFDTGVGTLAIDTNSGKLLPTSTAQKRLYHSARGYRYEDVQATVKLRTGATIAGNETSIVLKRLDASNYLLAYLNGESAGAGIQIMKVDGGALASLASGSFPVLAGGTDYWLRGRIERNVVTVEFFAAEPGPMTAPSNTVTHTLTGGNAVKFGQGSASGQVGLRLIPPATDWGYDYFTVEPFTYRNQALPDRIRLGGDVPGTAPALADIQITHDSGIAAAFALFGWNRNPTGGSTAYPFGVIDSADMNASDLTITADANARGGSLLTFDTATDDSKTPYIALDYSGLEADPFTLADVDIEVWARVRVASTVIAPKVVLYQASGITAVITYADGDPDGKALPVPSSGDRYRFVRIGVLPVYCAGGSTHTLQPRLECAAGSSGLLGLDYMILVPAKRRASSPSGKPLDANYPYFLQATSGTTRRIASSLEGWSQSSPLLAAGMFRAPGLGGAPIELPPTATPAKLDVLAKLSTLVPDDPTLDATSEQLAHNATVHLAVTPRSFAARG